MNEKVFTLLWKFVFVHIKDFLKIQCDGKIQIESELVFRYNSY